MDDPDWRTQLQPDSRSRIVNDLMETLKKHIPISGPEGLLAVQKIASRFEEKIYAAAVSQSDYLWKINLKMLTFETKSQNTSVPNSLQPAPAVVPGPVLSCSRNQEQVVFGFIDNNNWCPAQAEPSMDAPDWRTQLLPASRSNIVNNIMEMLKKHLPISGTEGLVELQKIAMRFEEKIYAAAVSQSDYLRKINLKMLTLETKSQKTRAPNWLQPSPAVGNQNSPDSGCHQPVLNGSYAGAFGHAEPVTGSQQELDLTSKL